MKKIFFLMVVLLSGLFVSCNNKPQPEDQGGSEKEAILRTIELYMEGSRQADSGITGKAFAEGATLAGVQNGRLSNVPIRVLYDLVDSKEPGTAAYTLTACSVEKDIAMVRIESQFGDHRYTDMFTLVKDAGEWKIISKVYHLHE